MPKISARIHLLAEQLIPDLPVWDFCCDHGYLGILAGLSGRHPEVHFVDQVPNLILKLQDHFQSERYPVSAQTQFGFWPVAGEEISEPVNGNVVIAGVGGYPMMTILLGLEERGLLRAKRLILSPHKSEARMKEFYRDSDHMFIGRYGLLRVLNTEERGRNREIWVFESTDSVHSAGH